MAVPVLLKCVYVDNKFKKRYNDTAINLEKAKAERLARKGIIRILGNIDNKSKKENKETNNKKYKALPRTKALFRRVEGKAINTVSIPVFTPWCDYGRIGKAYNDLMEKFVEDWVIFTDHDVLFVNPFWHDICIKAINKIGHKAGWMTCFTNRIGCKFQKAPGIDRKNDDIRYHREYARKLYFRHKNKVTDLTVMKGGRFSGMFILTHKQAWKDAGGFLENIGFFNVDCRYFTAVKKAGYHVYRMDNLYVYHGYFREVLKPYFQKKEVL